MTRWFDVLIYISLFQLMLLYFCWLLDDDERTKSKNNSFRHTPNPKQQKNSIKNDMTIWHNWSWISPKKQQHPNNCLLFTWPFRFGYTIFFSIWVDFYFFLLMNFDRIDKVNTHTEKKQCVNFSIMLLLLLAADDIIK